MTDLAYPHIAFNDSIVGPAQETKAWRDGIGVAAQFGRGSEVPTTISSIQEFASIYGLDSTPGSLFVQQAMANGVTNFTICRASAASNPATTKITFSSGNSAISPRLGYTVQGNSLIPNTHRTTGLRLELNYVSDAIVVNSLYSKVTTKKALLDLPSFNGRSRFNFYVTKAVEGNSNVGVLHNTQVTLEVEFLLSSIAGYQIATVKKNAANLSVIRNYLQPGYSLTVVGEAGTDRLLLASGLLDISNTHYGLLVKADQRHTNTVKGFVAQSTVLQTAGQASVHVDKLVGGNSALSPFANPGFLKTMKLLIDGKIYTQSANPLLVTDSGVAISTLADGTTLLSSVTDGASGDIAIGDEVYTTTGTFVTTEGGGLLLNEGGGQTLAETLSPSGTGDLTTGYRFYLTEELPALSSGTTVEFLPSVLAVNSSTKEITIQGLLRPEDITAVNGVGYSLSIDGLVYSVASVAAVTAAVTPTNTIGQLKVTVNESVPSSIVGKAINLLKKTHDDYQVKFPKKAQYVIGYSYDTESNSSLSSSYYSLDESYNDGFANYKIDSYFLLNEDSGGVFTKFFYQEVTGGIVNQNSPTFLTSKDIGIEILWGNLNVTSLPLQIGGQFNVPFAKASILVGAESTSSPDAYLANTSVSEVVRDLEAAIRSDSSASSLIEKIEVDDTSSTPSITLTSSHNGEKANRIAWKLQRYQTGLVNDVVLAGSSTFDVFNYLEGGYDGATFAYKDLYAADGSHLWRIIALTPGLHGNNLRCTVSNQKVKRKYGSFQLDVLDLNTRVNTGETKKSFVVDTSNIDSTTGRSLAFLATSNVQAYFMPVVKASAAEITLSDSSTEFRLTPQRLAPPLQALSSAFNTGFTAFSSQGIITLQNFNLSNGSDSSQSDNSSTSNVNGLIKAIQALESYNIALLALPGITYGDPIYQPVFDAAKASVESSTAESGLRSAIFELPPNISPERAQLLSDELDSERIILVAGRQLMRSRNNQQVPNVGSSGSYAGYDLSRAPHISPAASFAGSLVQAVSSVDTQTTSVYLDKMARAGVEVLVYDQNMGGFRFSNGLTTSRNSIKRYRSVVRILDQIKSDLYLYLQWVRSRPNTSALQSEAATACDAYLYSKLRDGWFTRLDNTICNATNNSQKDQVEGRLNIRIRLTPSFPADKILVNTILDLTEDFSLQTAV